MDCEGGELGSSSKMSAPKLLMGALQKLMKGKCGFLILGAARVAGVARVSRVRSGGIREAAFLMEPLSLEGLRASILGLALADPFRGVTR